MATEINLTEYAAQLEQMSPEDLAKTLLDMRVKQVRQSQKAYNPEAAKKARQKRVAMQQALREKAKALGIWEHINEKAKAIVAGEAGEAEADAEIAAAEDAAAA